MNIRLFICSLAMSTIMPAHAITYLFSHGLAATKAQANAYRKTNAAQSHIIDDETHTVSVFDYPDAQDGLILPDPADGWLNIKKHLKTISYRVNRYHTSFAQGNEIQVLHQQHAQISDTDIIGVGISRGASTFITWLGTHQDKKKTENIKALVLESPFDSIDSVVCNMLGSLAQYPTMRAFGHNLVRFIFSQYKKRAPSPHDAAADVPKDLPILIVCSEEDSRVPASSSAKLYEQLKNTDHQNVHFVKLSRGVHGKLIQGPEGETYRNAVHAFYKKYNLPYTTEYAEQGEVHIS